ncbi:pyridoxamine 5'-phosphate oxidase family protein [Nocardia callitridis]|uniref:Pyridoxamine 5'-phosphate oxidase N-terminal domain-containing protein n=1 Tax=Nocardia callitridis TaxID=648753 RepID=A0ABP9KU51_9NOCA
MSTKQQPGTNNDAVLATLTEVLRSTSVDLATAHDGAPWASNAFFVQDDNFRLRLVLESGGTTLRHLRANPRIGLKIVPSGLLQPFAQGVGTVEVLDPAELDPTFDAVVAKAPDLAPFRGAPIDPIAVTVEWWRVTHVEQGWLPGRVVHREQLA